MRTRINKITAILLSVLAVVSILTVIPAVEVNAAVDGTISWGRFDSSGHTRHYYIQNSNGKSLGFCVDPKLNSPDTGKYTFNQYTKENALISKIFYYGYQGIGNGKSITLNGVTKTANAFLTAKLASYGTASAGYNLHNMTHEALAYVYHGKNGNYCKYPNTAKAIADYISTFPAVPPATVYTSKGKTSNQQDIMYAEFWVHFLVIKNSSDDSTPASMAGVKYGIYNSSSKQIATVELEKNYSQTDATKKFQGTQAGVYVNNNSFSGVINLSGRKVNGKTAGSLYRMTDSSYTASETQTNSAFQKNNAKYTMVYYTNASDGHAILVPKLASNDTWPKDTLNIKLQMLKVSANSSSPSPLTGAVYAVSNDKNCDFTKVAAGMRITIGADGYGALGQANSGNQRNRTTADGENAKYAGKPSGQTFSQTKGKKWYCKEIVAPRGYELDDRIYEFSYDNITDTAGIPIFRPAKYEGNQRKRLSSTDMPVVKLQLAKNSDLPEITNNNDCYSFENAEFDIFWKEDSAGTVSPGCDYTAYTGSGTSGYVIKTDSDGYGYISKDRDGNLIASSGTNRNDSEETVFYGKPSGPNIRLMPGRTYYCKERVSPNNFTKRDAYYEFVDTGVTDSDGIPIFRASNATMVDAESVFSAEGLWGDEHKSLTGNSNAITNAIVGDPFSLYINKTDSTYSGSGRGRSLSNAIFKVNYYDIESSSAEVDQIAVAGPDGSITKPPTLLEEIENSKKAPKKTWYINTTYDSQTNKYYSSLEDARLTSFGVEQSSSLFKDANGQVFIPLGIVSVEEVQAPRGFQKTNNIYLYNLKYNDFASPEIENRPTIDIENTPTKAYVGVIKKNTEDERVAGALYYLYDSYEKASGSGFTNIENCIATATTTTAPEGDVFVSKTDGTTPYECIANKQYCIREVSAPEGYELDPTIYNITPKTTNNTVAKMATRTSVEGDVPYGSLKISKTSNEELVTPWPFYNHDVYTCTDDGSGQKTFLKDNTSLKNMCFAVWKYDGDTYDSDLDPMPTTELNPSYDPVEIGTTDENGQIQWDRLMVYKEGSSTEKQHYLVKELGYEVFFPEGTDRLVFQDGKFKWAIKKDNCIKIGNRYFEGLTNPVFTTNFKALTKEVVSNVLYPKYFYGDKREAIGNARGRVVTLEENGTVTEFTKPFHNTVPTTKLEIDKTMYTGEGKTALFEVVSEYGNMQWSNSSVAYDYCVQGSVEISGLPACVPKSDTSICIPMKYSITEKGLVTNGAITFVEGIMDKPKIEDDALYVPVEIDDRKVTFTAKNNPKTYTVSLHKDAFDENEEHNNVKDIWFEIVGVITDQTIADSVSGYNLIQFKASLPKFLALPKDEIKSKLAKYYAAQCESPDGDDPYQQYFPGVSRDSIAGFGIYDCGDDTEVDRVLPILGYDKNGNPITRVTIKTDQNGDAQSHFFNGEEIVDNPEYVHLWSIQDNPDGTSTWIDRTAQDNVGSILYGRENTLLPEGERLDAREKLKGFVIHPMDEDIEGALNYAIGIRVSELGKLTDPSDPSSFAIDGRYLVPEPQYDIANGVNPVLTYSFDNCPIVKDLELLKKNDSDESLMGSVWLMYDKQTDSPIKVIYDQEEEKYVFSSIGNADELIDAETEQISDDYALVTNSDGNIYVKDIPYGEYYLKEEEPPEGYVPYGEPIYFEVTEDGEPGDLITRTYTVVDGSNIMPNTGGTKTVLPIVIVSIAIPAAILTTFYLFKKRKRKIK